MTIVNAVAIHPRSGEVWEELQKQLKKAIQIVKKHGGENVVEVEARPGPAELTLEEGPVAGDA